MERGHRRRPVDRARLEGRYRGQPRLSKDRAQLQSDDGDRRQDDGRRGRASGRARPDRSRPHRHAGRVREADRARTEREETHRAAHRAQARTTGGSPPAQEWKCNGLDPRTDGRARRQGAARRLLRQSRHRHPDAGVELHSERHERAVAERKRHARLRSVPLRRRRGPRPHQRRQADHHGDSDHELFLLGGFSSQ